jgi:AcrR family transcriptional regulator
MTTMVGLLGGARSCLCHKLAAVATAPDTAVRLRSPLDRETIVRTARDLLDETGIEGLTMAGLGERLGVTGMALYRHVEDRRELEQAVVELVLRDIVINPGAASDWASGVADWMRDVRAHLVRHPWVTALMGTQRDLSPPWLATLDRLVTILEPTGLPAPVLAREIVRITRITVGITLQEVRAPLPHAAAKAQQMLDDLTTEAHPRWTGLIDELTDYTNDDLFEDVIADTVERLRRQGARIDA